MIPHRPGRKPVRHAQALQAFKREACDHCLSYKFLVRDELVVFAEAWHPPLVALKLLSRANRWRML
eukprot:8522380-Pyramimonas_sp.AAC.1